MENKNNLSALGLILGGAIVFSFLIGSFTFYKVRTLESISVTGSAKKAVVSDQVKWIASINRQVRLVAVKEGYAKMAADLAEVKTFLSTNGVPENEIVVNPIFMQEIWDNSDTTERNYNLMQNIEIRSMEVSKMASLAQNTSLVTEKGVLLVTQSLEYYYSKLPEVRIELLEAAVGDAKARAEKLASAGGKKIGALKSASSGVVQVLSPNSAEVTDYGSYNTQTIEKEIMVTVKASFSLK
jgi:uncharacterized protein